MRLRPLALALAVLWTGQGCYKWSAQSKPVAQLVTDEHPLSLRLTLRNGAQVSVGGPRVVGDSLLGVTQDGSTQVAVPLSEIRSVEVEKVDAVKTVLLAAGIGITVAAIVGAARQPPPPPRTTTTCTQTATQTCSCPMVYSWDGSRWRLDAEPLGGALAEALRRREVDNLRHATSEHGIVRLRLANEQAETDYIDGISVLAVDHEPGTDIVADPSGRLHAIHALTAPLAARDFRGHDALERVSATDGWNWESVPTDRDPGRPADVRDGLELVFIRPAGATRAHLVLDGNNSPWGGYMLGEFVAQHGRATAAWYDSLNTYPGFAMATGMALAREGLLSAAVRVGERWAPQGQFGIASEAVEKRQVLELDLSAVRGDTIRVRLESIPSVWLIDRVAMDFSPDAEITTRELRLASARDRSQVDVSDLIATTDRRYLVLETGDQVEMRFEAPEDVPGLSRSYILRSSGWHRIRTPETGEPAVAELSRIFVDPLALSKSAVTRMNAALERLAESGAAGNR